MVEGYKKTDKFWDEECHKRKEELKKEQEKVRDQRISEEEWRKKKKEYKEFINGKKREKQKCGLMKSKRTEV